MNQIRSDYGSKEMSYVSLLIEITSTMSNTAALFYLKALEAHKHDRVSRSAKILLRRLQWDQMNLQN